jgi:predicted permease
MRPAYGWKRAFRLFRSAEDELHAEILGHLETRIEQLKAEGVSWEEAERAARAELGDPGAAVQASLAASGPTARWPLAASLESLRQDFRFAGRSLRRRPGFGFTVVAVLGLVIAVNAAVTAVVSAYLLRALPYPHPDRVASVTRTPPGRSTMASDAPVPSGLNNIVWPRSDSVMEYSAAWELDGFGFLSGGDPEVVGGAWVTAGFFPITGARTQIGRVFTQEEVKEGAAVAVISHGLWQRRFGGNTEVLGSVIRSYSNDRPADAESFRVIGVLTSDFWSFATDASDLFVPLRGTRRPVLVRLREGVSPGQAGLHLTRIARARLDMVDPRWRMHVTPLQEGLYRDVAPSLRVLAGTALLVLLIAAGNLAVLLLMRSVVRGRELSIRSALGAGRARIFQQLAVEGFLLTAAAGAVGLFSAHAVLDFLAPTIQSFLGAPAPGGDGGLALDARTWVVTAAMCAGVAALFGIVPALAHRPGFRLLRASPGTEAERHSTVRRILVGTEVALSLALLVGAGLLARSTARLHRMELGFEARGLALSSLALRERSYPEEESRIRFFDPVLKETELIPAIHGAAIASRFPFQFGRGDLLAAEGAEPALTRDLRAAHHTVSQDYFAVMGIPLLAGRGFEPSDRLASDPVVVVSRELAERLWPGGTAIGRRLRLGSWKSLPPEGASPWRRVVGVVEDVRTTRTGEDFPETYTPYRQDARSHMYLIVRTDDPDAAQAGVRAAVAEVDSEQPLGAFSPMESIATAELLRPRFLTGVLVSFALFALLLTLFGLYAVIAYAAAQRQRELAIRMALGAGRPELVGRLLRQGLGTVGAGAAAGLLGAALLSRVLASQLYGVSPLEPLTYASLTVATIVAALAAIWVPARRAARVDPAKVLREQ